MPWFYVDDGFSDSKPVLNMSDRHRLAACGLWVLSGSWSAKEELDGFVPDTKLRQLGARPPLLAALTEPGPMSAPLCERTERGIQFNSWDKWQPTREELNEKRREDAERQRAWRAAHPEAKVRRKPKGRNASASSNLEMSQRDTPVTEHVTNSVTDASETEVSRCDTSRAPARGPDPTRPDPTQKKKNGVDLGGELTQVAPTEPPPQCPRHLNHTDPPPCQGCRQAREANEAWNTGELDRRRAARADAKAIADTCPVCQGTNWIPDTDPAVKCHHREHAHA